MVEFLVILPSRQQRNTEVKAQMNVIVVDDELLILHGEAELIRRVLPGAEINAFQSANEALHYAQTRPVDVAFLDIEMKEMSGVDLGRRLKRLHPDVNVIFSTAYDHYYADAMNMHASGYIIKPIREDRVREELQELRRPVQNESSGLFVRAFGDFEVFYNGAPLLFRYQKTKEMFAYLIDRRGAMVESETLITVLWGGETDRSNFFKQIRKDFNDTLASLGLDDVVLRRRGSIGLLTEKIPCDYFDWLKGVPAGINAYHGEYMRQYDWAESTWVNLEGKSNLWE